MQHLKTAIALHAVIKDEQTRLALQWAAAFGGYAVEIGSSTGQVLSCGWRALE
jgi:hypothetical protein